MVVDVQQDGGGMPKLACSMRAVDQESGQPLMSLEEAVQRYGCGRRLLPSPETLRGDKITPQGLQHGWHTAAGQHNSAIKQCTQR